MSLHVWPIGAGEGGGDRGCRAGAQGYENDAEYQDRCAGDEREGDEGLEALDAIDEEGPDEIVFALDAFQGPYLASATTYG